MHNFARECQSHWRKNLLTYIRYVATIPCKSLRHKSSTFHTNSSTLKMFISITFTKPVSMKQTKHSRKSEAQNLCSKCPPFTRTHAFKRLHHCAIADGFGNSVQSWWLVGATQLHFWEPGVKVNSDYYRNTVLLNMLLLNIRSVLGDYYVFQQDKAPAHRARDTVTMQQRETPEFIPPEMWPPNSPDLNLVDYSIWGMLQERVYRSWIHDVS